MTGKGPGSLTMHGATKDSTAHDTANAERARRYVASVAEGREDCARLLDMLGLVPPGAALTVDVSVARLERKCEQ